MKIKNSFLIPFIFFCCGKPDPQSTNDANIKKTEDELKKRFEQDESCKKIHIERTNHERIIKHRKKFKHLISSVI